jgi:tetratricopeptide (TPR) repeat protein
MTRMKKPLFPALLLGSTVLLSACQEDPEQAANAAFVQAMKTVEEAGAIKGTAESDLTQRVKLTEGALAAFDKIVTDYPQSSVAVKIISERKVGTVDLAAMEEVLDQTKRDLACLENRKDCIGIEIGRKFAGIELDDSSSPAWFQSSLSDFYATAGMVKEFEATLVTLSDPTDRIRPLTSAGRIDEALAVLGDPSSADPTDVIGISVSLSENGQTDRAKELATIALANLNPDPSQPYSEDWSFLAYALAKAGDTEKAREVYVVILEAAAKLGGEDALRHYANNLREMAEVGLAEEARKHSAVLRSLFDTHDLKVPNMRGLSACAFKKIGDLEESDRIVRMVEKDAKSGKLDDETYGPIYTFLSCGINEAFVVEQAEKIIAKPSAFGADTKEDELQLQSDFYLLLGKKDLAASAFIDRLKLHHVDPEQSWRSALLVMSAKQLLQNLQVEETPD